MSHKAQGAKAATNPLTPTQPAPVLPTSTEDNVSVATEESHPHNNGGGKGGVGGASTAAGVDEVLSSLVSEDVQGSHGDNHHKADSSLAVPETFFHMNDQRTWFLNNTAEAAFLEFQMDSCGYRLIGLCAGIAVVSIIRTLSNSLKFTFIIALTITVYMTLALFADLFLVLLRKRQRQKVGVTSSRGCGSTLMLAKLHEYVAVFVLLSNCVAFTLVYAYQQDTCIYFLEPSDDRENHEQCPYRMQMFWYFVSMVPVLVGTPRFFYVVWINLLRMGLTVALLRFHDTSDEVTGMVYTIQAAFLVFVCALKWMNEHQERVRFQAKWTLQFQTLQLRRKSEAVKQLVFSTTPLHLRSRLTSSAFKLQVDIAHEAVCLLVDIFEVQKFMTSMLPVASATRVAKFNARILCEAEDFKMAHIRTIGDTSCFVGNLFGQEESEQRDTVECIRNSLSLAATISSKSRIYTRAGVGVGFLIGSPVGQGFVRYDIFGPALANAREAISQCPARETKLCPNSKRLLKGAGDSVEESSSTQSPTPLSSTNSHTTPQILTASTEFHAESGTSAHESDEQMSQSETRQLSSFDPEAVAKVDIYAIGGRETKEIVLNSSATESPHQADDIALSHSCLVDSFQDPETQEKSARQQRIYHLRPATITVGFYTLFFALLSVTLILDRRSSVDTPLIFSFIFLSVAVIGNGVMTVLLWREKEAHSEAIINTVRILGLFAFCGAQISRSSLIGDDCGYLLFVLQISQLSLGGATLPTVGYQILLTIGYHAFMAFRPLVDTPQLMLVVPAAISIIYCCIMYNNREKEHFVQLAKVVTTHAEVRAQEQIRQSMLDALVPSTLRWRVTPETIKASRVDSWGVDDCVVLAFGLHYNTEQFNEWVSVPQKIRDFNSKTLGLIEDLVGEVPHGRLKTVSMFGGNILAAGPLEDKNKKPEVKTSSANLKRSSIDEALEDTVVFLANFLKRVTSVEFTAGVTIEQVINLLCLTETPSYDLLGPAVSTAQAIQAEAPTKNMIVMTEKCGKLLVDRCHDAMTKVRLHLSRSESWRVRYHGNLRVQRVVLQRKEDLRHASSSNSTADSTPQTVFQVVSVPDESDLHDGGAILTSTEVSANETAESNSKRSLPT